MKKFIVYILISCVFTTWSCTDLDEKLYHDVTADQYYKNGDEVIAAMMRPWAHWSSVMTFFKAPWRLQELPADAVSFPQKGIHGYDGGDWIRYHRHQWTTEENHLNDAWNNLYAGVGYVNNLLAEFERVDFEALKVPISRQQAEAELKVYRAYCYWYLIDLFGDVPYSLSIAEVSPATISKKEIFDHIVKEIKDNVQYLTTDLADGYGRVTQYGANTLLAYLYLNAEVYTGAPKWQECVDACDAVLNAQINGKAAFELDANWYTPFQIENDKLSKENIWSIALDKVYAAENSWFQRWFHYAQTGGFSIGYGAYNSTVVTPSFWKTFGKNDQRGYLGHSFGPQYKVTKLNDDRTFVVDKTKPMLGTEEYKGYPCIIANDEVSFNVVNDGNGIKLSIRNAPEFSQEDLQDVINYMDTARLIVKNLKEQIAASGSPFVLYLSRDYTKIDKGAENIGARSMKYQLEYGSSIAGISNDWVIFRLSGIYFTKAEALMRINGNVANQAVVDLINPISERAWDPGTFTPYTATTLTMDEFLAEHGREFAYEGRRRQDMIRFDKFVTTSWWDHEPSNNRVDHVFPIPDRRLNNNSNLKPNEANAQRNK